VEKPDEVCLKCGQPIKSGELTNYTEDEHILCPFQPLWKPRAKAAAAGK